MIVGSREFGARRWHTMPAPRPWWVAVVVLLLALPIFAHGCHTGDHDDEPLLVPVEERERDTR